MVEQQEPRWVTMATACAMFHINRPKLDRLVREHHFQVKMNIRDKRQRLIDVNELKRLLGE